MTKIVPINSTNYSLPKSNLSPEERKQQKEQVAAGVGGAAGLSSAATKVASKKGLKPQAAEAGLMQMLEGVKNTTNAVNKNTKAARGLFATFKENLAYYPKDITRRLKAITKSKFVTSIIENVVTQKMIGAAGGILAFFVLVTGVNKAVKTGAIAVDDFKNQYKEFRNVA